MARCLGVFSRDQPEDLAAPVPFLDDRDDLELTSQAHEARHESHLVPFVARIGAGFMLNQRRRWQDSDSRSVPPSPEKYGKRRVRANRYDREEISSMLAIPVRTALTRKPGGATREASYDELSNQFSLD